MTATGDVAHYDVTRLSLIGALAGLPLTEHMLLERRGELADAILAGLPATAGVMVDPADLRMVVTEGARADWTGAMSPALAAAYDHLSAAVGDPR